MNIDDASTEMASVLLRRDEMVIDIENPDDHITDYPVNAYGSDPPFGGAELNLRGVSQVPFRSTERRLIFVVVRGYKDVTPTE